MILMRLPYYVSKIIEQLEQAGFEAYAVGGCVRDILLGIEPKDYDVATSALPEQTERVFKEYRIIETGLKHGTVTVLSEGNPIEITTYRIDGEYTDHRRPDKVLFTPSLEEDLKRRDFTINAMAYSQSKGIIDCFGGKSDLEKGIIRCVGEPARRFDEDGLRIMRALRFASVYGFEIEEKTAEKIHEYKHLLKNISAERIYSELVKLLCGKCGNVIRDFSDVLSVFIPEINRCKGFLQHSKYHDKDVLEHIISTVEASPAEKNIRLAMLLHDLGKPDYFYMENGVGHFKGHAQGSARIAERVMRELKADRETADNVVSLVQNHDITLIDNPKTIKRQLSRFGEKLFFDEIKVHIADDMGKAEAVRRVELYKRIKSMAEEIIAERQCFSLKQLEVKGGDLIALGYKGEEIGKGLNLLLNAVIDEKCANNKKDLLTYLANSRDL
ncbi:MAG: CCA tRNA nucleotidyltransferase [Ruminiclostridium sp.]